MTFYDEPIELLRADAWALNSFYPESRLVVCCDKRDRIKLPQFRGRWTERWMKAALATPCDRIMKVDPDTRCLGRIAEWPEADMFGMVSPRHTYWDLEGVPYGCALGFSRDAVQRIVDSGLLLGPQYQGKPYIALRNDKEWISLQDPIVWDVARKLGLTFEELPGLSIRRYWDEEKPETKDVLFAHPVRTIDV